VKKVIVAPRGFRVKGFCGKTATRRPRGGKTTTRGRARKSFAAPGPGFLSLPGSAQQQPQQTGVLFIITQQVQPSLSMVAMQSQQAWIISQHFGSPLVQVMTHPLSIISHLHRPMVRLQQQTIMPFIIMQQLHMPPAIMVQRFCIMLHAIGSSQVQTIFMPPWHFSNLKVQRGTIIQLPGDGIPAAGPAPAPMPGIPIPVIPVRSTIIVLAMSGLLSTMELGRVGGFVGRIVHMQERIGKPPRRQQRDSFAIIHGPVDSVNSESDMYLGTIRRWESSAPLLDYRARKLNEVPPPIVSRLEKGFP
jgi:hypothetical protein